MKRGYLVDNYFDNYILSYFDVKKIRKTSQILHVLRGKKTPSMYYLTEKNNWHHGFSLERRIEESDLKIIIHSAVLENILIKKERGFLLTQYGKKYLNNFFKNHYYPQKIKRFKNIELYNHFWEQTQLFTQVFSEYSYKNNNYLPIIKNPHQQEKIRQLLRATKGKTDLVLLQWTQEQEFVFSHLGRKKANIIANLLTGHKNVGKTRKQLINNLKMTEYEFKFYLRDILEEIINIIKKYSTKLILNSKIVNQITDENFMSMSKSTYETYKLLKKGEKIRKIARHKKVKENTIKEHILEIAFVIEDFPIKKFVPNKIHKYLHIYFSQNKRYSFKEVKTEKKELDFFYYRLVELERMRMD